MRITTCICLLACVFGTVLSDGSHAKGFKKFGISGDAALKLGVDLVKEVYISKEMKKEIPLRKGKPVHLQYKVDTLSTIRFF